MKKREILTLEGGKGFLQLLEDFRKFFRLENKAEVLRLGLACLSMFKEVRRQGNKVAILNEKGKVLKEIVW